MRATENLHASPRDGLPASVAGSDGTVTLPIGLIDAVSAATTDKELFQAAADWLPRSLDVSRCSLARARAGRLQLTSFTGGRIYRQGTMLDLERTQSGQVFLQRRPMVTHNMTDSPWPLHGKLVEAGFRTIMAAPLVTGDRCLGTLQAMHKEPYRFTDLHIQQLCAVARWIASRLDILERMDEVRQLSVMDALTGCMNRRAFLERASDAFWEVQGGDGTLSVILFDLDHFKKVNDTHGHAAGDTVLREVTGAIRKRLRRYDLLARLGGEEFAVLLPDAPQDVAEMLAERIRSTVESLRVSIGDTTLLCTISLGVAEAQLGDETLEALMNRADRALYRAKAEGRNLVRSAGPAGDRDAAP